MKNYIKDFSRFQRINEQEEDSWKKPSEEEIKNYFDDDANWKRPTPENSEEYPEWEEDAVGSAYKLINKSNIPIVKLTIVGPSSDDIIVLKNLDNGNWVSGGYDETTLRLIQNEDAPNYNDMTNAADLDTNKEVDWIDELFDDGKWDSPASTDWNFKTKEDIHRRFGDTLG